MDNPLTKTDLANIKSALAKLNEAQPLIELLERCEQDQTERKEKCQFLQKVLMEIRTSLFPMQA